MFSKLFNKTSNRDKYPDWAIQYDHPAVSILMAGSLGRALLAMNDGQPQRIYSVSTKECTSIDSLAVAASYAVSVYCSDTDEVFLINKDTQNSDIVNAHNLAHEIAHRFQHRQKDSNLKFKNAFERTTNTLLKEVHAHYIADIVLLQALQSFKRDEKNPQYCEHIERVLEGKSLSHLVDKPIETIEDIRSVAIDIIQSNFKTFLSHSTKDYVQRDEYVYATKYYKSEAFTAIPFSFGVASGVLAVLLALRDNPNAIYPALLVIPLLVAAHYSNKNRQSYRFKPKDVDHEKLFNTAALGKIPSLDGQDAIDIFDFDTLQAANGYSVQSAVDAIDSPYQKFANFR